jgi:uncharacterized protein
VRISGRRYRDQWIPNCYPGRAIGPDRFLRVSRSGTTLVLTAEENASFDEIFMSEELYERLELSGHIVTRNNAARMLDALQAWHAKTYGGPYLHIVVLTKRCNLSCAYCHMNPEPVGAKSTYDLQPEVAREIVRFALESPNPSLHFEFQGGEPFLNFGTLTAFVAEARRQNEHAGKDVSFGVVTNMMIATDAQLEFCAANDVSVSYTLDGPPDIHDHYRRSRNGSGSYDRALRRIQAVREKFPGLVSTSPLCVVDGSNADRLEEMIRFYQDQGFNGVAVIPLKHLGSARRSGLGIDVSRFLERYLAALDVILEMNRRGTRPFGERSVRVALAKILSDEDVGHVDWRNPCGDVSGSITYDYDGEILPMDEARSMRDEFSLGNVVGMAYDDLVRRKETFRTMNLSLRDHHPECRECAYNPLCGVSPVLEFARTGHADPVPQQAFGCLFTQALFDWVLRTMLEDPIPLMRMLPGMDAHLRDLVDQAPAATHAGAVAGDDAGGANGA